jgi:hypothetical protein
LAVAPKPKLWKYRQLEMIMWRCSHACILCSGSIRCHLFNLFFQICLSTTSRNILSTPSITHMYTQCPFASFPYTQAYCQGQEAGHLCKSKRALGKNDLYVSNYGQVSWATVWRVEKQETLFDSAWTNDFSHGHKFGNDLETGHQHICQTITYTIIIMLVLCTFTYLVKFHKYFRDFRVTLLCPTALEIFTFC